MNARFGYELIRGGIALLRQDTTTMSISAVVAKVLSRDASCKVADGYLREALFGLLGALLHERAPQDGYKGVDSDLGGAWDHADKYLLEKRLEHMRRALDDRQAGRW